MQLCQKKKNYQYAVKTRRDVSGSIQVANPVDMNRTKLIVVI